MRQRHTLATAFSFIVGPFFSPSLLLGGGARLSFVSSALDEIGSQLFSPHLIGTKAVV